MPTMATREPRSPVEDLMSRDDMTEDEVTESYSDDQIFEHAMDMMRMTGTLSSTA